MAQVNYSTVTDGEVTPTRTTGSKHRTSKPKMTINTLSVCIISLQVEQNWATLQSGEMTIQTTQASEATQAVASLAEAAVAASQEIQPGATVTMALNR